jgi:hypothetical protein
MAEDPGTKLVMLDVKRWLINMQKAERIILSFLFTMLIMPFVRSEVLVIDLDYQQGKFILNNTGVFDMNLPGGIRDTSEYEYKLFAVNQQILQEGSMIIPGSIVIERDFENNIPAEIIDTDVKRITLYIEYNSKLKNLIIYNTTSHQVLLNLDLLKYNRCNLNNICDENENKILCPEDCYDSLKDGICYNIEDGICEEDPDCSGKDPDCLIEEYKSKQKKVKDEFEEGYKSESKDVLVDVPKKEFQSKNNMAIKLTIFFVVIMLILLTLIIYLKRTNIE